MLNDGGARLDVPAEGPGLGAVARLPVQQVEHTRIPMKGHWKPHANKQKI